MIPTTSCKYPAFCDFELKGYFPLRHKGKHMDLSLSVRFANLPNNSQLEMKLRSGPREDLPVTIAVQAESGSRVQGQFLSSETLFAVISDTIGMPVTKKGQEVVCIFTRREVIGEELLKTTTLKSLGLTSGSAMLRVIVRDAGAMKTQAHVEDLKLRKPAGPSKAEEVVSDVKQNVSKFGKSLKKMVSGVFDSVTAPAAETKPVVEQKVAAKKEKSQTQLQSKSHTSCMQERARVEPVTGPPAGECLDMKWLGERDALVFTLEDMTKWRSMAKQEELTDEFFEHTQDDVLLIYNDLKQRIRDMDNRPLETAALREKKLTESRYSKTVLRICFPSDGLVIQATFLPHDTIATVSNFVRKYARDPKKPFYLYTTPPKEILCPEDTLIKKQLVPAALIHLGQTDVSEPVLSDRLKAQITSFNAIAAATASLRREIAERKQPAAASSDPMDQAAGVAEPALGTNSNVQDQKVPKWFKK